MGSGGDAFDQVDDRRGPSGAKAHSPVATTNRPAAANPSSLRTSNLSLIMSELVASHGGLSRSELAVRTGLTRPTISRLAQELIEAGVVVEETAVVDGRPGRPGRPLFPASRAVVGIGLEVNVHHIAGCAIDLLGSVAGEFMEYIDGEALSSDEVLELLGERTRQLVEDVEARGFREVSGIFLAVPSIVGRDQQSVIYASNLEWHSVKPLDVLGRYLPAGVPFVVENDANLQALASASAMSGTDDHSNSFLYVFGDYGVGGALIQDGKVVRGANGWAGEIGHMAIDPAGELCHCGALGCLETFAGRRAIMEKAGFPSNADVSVLIGALEQGDPSVGASVRRAGWALGIALANAVNLIDINQVIVGNGLGQLLPWMRDEIVRQLDVRLLGRDGQQISVLASRAGSNASSTGGALQALQSRVASPVP